MKHFDLNLIFGRDTKRHQAKNVLKVLIVDDEEQVRQTLSSYLDALDGFDVYVAGDALEGLKTVENNGGMDCVLADINMPGMDGIEFVKRLKGIDRTIVATIITGQPSMDIIVKAMRAGASDFLSKPFKFDQFRVAVERMVRERKILLENRFLAEEVKIKKTLERMNAQLEKKIREQAILFTISDALGKTRSTQDLYQKVVDLARTLTEAEQSRFWVVHHERGELLLVGSSGPDDPTLERISLNNKELPWVQVALDALPVIISGRKGNGNGNREAENPMREQVIVPFTIREEVFGVLSVAGISNGRTLGEEALFLLHLLAQRASLTVENLLLYDSITLNLHATLRALVRSLEAKDPYTKLHSERVTGLALHIAKIMGCSSDELDSLRFAGHLHDIGKIGIRDQILMKPGKLTKKEYEIIKTHPVIGEEIVSHLGLLPLEKSIIRHHHERWDGGGYPDGLKGLEIPGCSRILSVADTFDAITTRRPYRDAVPVEMAMEEIEKNAGSQFDPEVVEAFRIYMIDNPGKVVNQH